MTPPYHYSSSCLTKLKALLEAAKTKEDIYRAIVDAPFGDRQNTTHLGVGIIGLMLVNEELQVIDRVAYSHTELAINAYSMSAKPYTEIKVPVDCHQNLIAEAIHTGKAGITDSWECLFVPDLTKEDALFIQAGAGVDCSVVYPMKKCDLRGALVYSFFEPPSSLTEEHHLFMQSYTDLASSRLADIKYP